MNEEQRKKILTEASEALKKDDWNQAFDLYEQVYEINPTLLINKKLVKLSILMDKFYTAEQYLIDFIDDYLDTIEDLENLVVVFTKNQNYIACREVLCSVDDEDLYKHAILLLDRQEKKDAKILKETFKARMRDFKYLGANEVYVQLQRYQSGMQLPFSEYFEIAKKLLIDEDVVDMVRISILSSFVSIKVNGEIEFLWIDNKVYKLNFTNLIPPLDTQVAKKIEDTLYLELENDDPVTLNSLEQNIILRIRATFPFTNELITDPVTWTKYQIALFRGEKLPDLNQSDKEWLAKLDDIFGKFE